MLYTTATRTVGCVTVMVTTTLARDRSFSLRPCSQFDYCSINMAPTTKCDPNRGTIARSLCARRRSGIRGGTIVSLIRARRRSAIRIGTRAGWWFFFPSFDCTLQCISYLDMNMCKYRERGRERERAGEKERERKRERKRARGRARGREREKDNQRMQ